ncbi:MAG: hypothetical protein R6W90_02360, partial [Ignavibacteriaceae bacterium]
SLDIQPMQIDSTGNIPQEELMDTPIQTPVQKPVIDDEIINKRAKADSADTKIDSLEQRHDTIVDSLNRRPGVPGEMREQLKETIDSLNPSIIKESDLGE